MSTKRNYFYNKKFGLTPDVFFAIVIFILAAILNLQFLVGSNINYTLSGHDEYLTVREVYSIINPLSYKHFIMAIISGDVLYYGRVMFYIDALFSYLPYKVFGLDGMVYSIRMTHVLLILAGLIILARTFLINWKYRLIFYLGTMTLYYSAYFFMIPKPEPVQLFLLAIFLYLYVKNKYSFGRYFIFLGMAYGAKFNLITALPIFIILPFLNNDIPFFKQIKNLIVSGIYFLIGLIISIPCLILAPFKPVFIHSYWHATFANTGHYDDDKTLSILDWISKGWFGAYNGGMIGGILLVLLMSIVLIIGIKKSIIRKQISNEIIALLIGVFLIIPVLLFTQRIWPHYLWTGYIFIFLSLIIYVQQIKNHKFNTYFISLLITGVLVLSLSCSYKQGKNLFSMETQSISLQENGQQAYSYLQKNNDKFIAIQDISVPYPFREMLKVNRYNPFSASSIKMENQQFIWAGFISPEIIDENNADFILTYKLDFVGSNLVVHTDKDLTILKNFQLIKNELNKSVFPDTAFGDIKIYKVKK